MGRASASIQNRDLAKQFAQLVTAPTSCVNDMIARSGPLSIFAALAETCPECVRGRGVNQKYGIAEAEFNKAVQACGFVRERDRRVNAMTRSSDPLGAGMYLFSMRRWRDINDPEDLAELKCGWTALCERLPWIAKQCSLQRFMEIVSKFHDDWQPNAGRARKKPRFEQSASPTSKDTPSLSRGSTESSMDPIASLACSSPIGPSSHFNMILQQNAHRPAISDFFSRSSPQLTKVDTPSQPVVAIPDSSTNSQALMATMITLLQQQQQQQQQQQNTQMQLATLTSALAAQQKPALPALNLAQGQFGSLPLPKVSVGVPSSFGCNVQSLVPSIDFLGLGKRDRPACMQFS